ncbi:MAG: AsmA-like C-terminal region-containing protein [Bacteroidia bacterium]
MWQKIKKPFFITLIILGSLLLLGVGTSVLFGDKIIEHVIGEVNKNLNTKVEVKQVSFSIIRKFPNAAIELQNVYAAPAKPFAGKDTLLYADKIYLLFDLFDVLRGNYDLKKVQVENATVQMITDTKGNKSFDVWKNDSTQKNKNNFQLNFDEVSFKNVQFVYRDFKQQKFYGMQLEDTHMNGKFGDASYQLKMNGDVYVYKTRLGNEDYITLKKAKLNFNLKVDNVNNVYVFEPSTLQLEGLKLGVQGRIRYLAEQTEIDLSLNGKDADIISLLSIIPKSDLGALSDYDAKGSVTFNAKISGAIAAHQSPVVAINFSTKNSELTPPHASATLKNISFSGFFTNKKSTANGVNYLSLKNVKADLEGQKLSANFEMENSVKPFINMMMDGNFDLKKLAEFYKPDTLSNIEGTLLINAAFKGQIGNAATYSSSGTAQFQKVNFELKQSPTSFKKFSSTFILKDNELQVDRLSGNVAGSDFRVNGVIDNIFDYIFLDNQTLNIDADFLSNKINLDEIITKGDSKNDTAGGIHFSPNLNCNMIVSVGELDYKKFSARRINGSVTLEDGVLHTNSLNMQTMDGSVNLQGSIDASRGDSILILYNANVTQLNITKAFEEMGNFGQTTITDKNLKGKVTATVQFASVWSRQLAINTNSIYSKCDITIENGELINFEPMLALGRYVKGSDLRNIKFETLHNIIEIKNKKLIIPVMDIRSTAVNLTASGTHSFDNMVDYKIKMELSQLLNKKVRDFNTEFGIIEDDGLGRWKLYLSMKGNLSNPKFAYDKKGVQENIAQQAKQEKQTMKVVLNKEFGWFKKDSTIAKQNQQQQKKKEEIQIEYEEDTVK